MTPFFSVVIPTFNRLTMLKETLASVDAQTFRDFEIVVADDGSTDGTLEWLAAERPDVVVEKAGGRGAGGARNTGISAARGHYVSLLDSDDLWHPQALEQVAAVTQERPDAVLVIVREERFPDSKGPAPFGPVVGRQTEEYGTLLDVATSCKGFAGTSVWGGVRRELFAEVGPFHEDRRINMEDLDWLFLAGDHGPVLRIVEPALLAYRLHDTQISKDPLQFFRSVKRFFDAERKGLYPDAEKARRRNYIASMSLLPIRLHFKAEVIRWSLESLAEIRRTMGLVMMIRWLPRHLLCSLRSYLRSWRAL